MVQWVGGHSNSLGFTQSLEISSDNPACTLSLLTWLTMLLSVFLFLPRKAGNQHINVKHKTESIRLVKHIHLCFVKVKSLDFP